MSICGQKGYAINPPPCGEEKGGVNFQKKNIILLGTELNVYICIEKSCKLGHFSHDGGTGQFTIFFHRNWMRDTEYVHKTHVHQPAPIMWVGVRMNLIKKFALGNTQNVQDCTEKSCLSTLHPKGLDGVGQLKNPICFWFSAMSIYAQKSHFCHPYPHRVGGPYIGVAMGWRWISP